MIIYYSNFDLNYFFIRENVLDIKKRLNLFNFSFFLMKGKWFRPNVLPLHAFILKRYSEFFASSSEKASFKRGLILSLAAPNAMS